MGPSLEMRQSLLARQVGWRGRSGRLYTLSPERLEDFALRNNELFLIARGSLVLWAGSADEVIHDPQSRARFRLALDCADRAYHVESVDNDVQRMIVVWDLEGGEPVAGLTAA